MITIDIRKIEKDSKNFKLNSGNSYIQTYKTFTDYFKKLDVIKREHLIIGSHLVYGWMPTILHLNLKQEKEALSILNSIKKGGNISLEEILTLKSTLNNSMVGTSKLLHFINPKKYPIWDSRIYKYIYGKMSQYGVQNPKKYLEYVEEVNRISKEDDFKKIYMKYSGVCRYKVTPVRLAELIMFEKEGRNR